MIRATLTGPIETWAQWQSTGHVEVFEIRCWTVAELVKAGKCDFHDAVDLLQHEAERNGIPDSLEAFAEQAESGQDIVQEIMADAFRPRPARPISRTYELPPSPVVPPQSAAKEQGAPQVTLEALMWAFREGG